MIWENLLSALIKMPELEALADGPPDVREIRDPNQSPWAELTGAWNLRSLEPVLHALESKLKAIGTNVGWDTRSISVMDHAGALLLWRAWNRRRPSALRLKPEHEALIERLAQQKEAEPPPPRRYLAPAMLYVGEAMLTLFDHIYWMILLLGRVVLDAGVLFRNPSRGPWREISANLYRTGAQALGITALVGFLVGVVLSYLSAQQLKQFGAEIYIINLLGVSVVRELGPVLAAILVAGRSGSAMTAQLGVMRVTEEIDAMAVMGIPHTLRLILPKMIALAIALPLLILWTNAVALLGGMVSAQVQLGLSYHYFLSALPAAVPISNLWLGLAKGVVFGILIALIACHFGLRIKPNTESLGVGTTNSVVTAITVVIIVDAIFAIMFSDVGSF
jgi:phospholipid/cholesterol/gamma-HCH transport system permease protein